MSDSGSYSGSYNGSESDGSDSRYIEMAKEQIKEFISEEFYENFITAIGGEGAVDEDAINEVLIGYEDTEDLPGTLRYRVLKDILGYGFDQNVVERLLTLFFSNIDEENRRTLIFEEISDLSASNHNTLGTLIRFISFVVEHYPGTWSYIVQHYSDSLVGLNELRRVPFNGKGEFILFDMHPDIKFNDILYTDMLFTPFVGAANMYRVEELVKLTARVIIKAFRNSSVRIVPTLMHPDEDLRIIGYTRQDKRMNEQKFGTFFKLIKMMDRTPFYKKVRMIDHFLEHISDSSLNDASLSTMDYSNNPLLNAGYEHHVTDQAIQALSDLNMESDSYWRSLPSMVLEGFVYEDARLRNLYLQRESEL